MNTSASINMKQAVFASLFTAFMIIGVYVKVPIGPVPIVFSNMFVLLAGVILGSRWGTISVMLYIFLGIVGLPVFSAGGGIARLIGPTGGYIAAYIPAAFITGYISHRKPSSKLMTFFALVSGTIVIYTLGVPWLKIVLKLSWGKALLFGMLPFLPGDIIKIFAALGITAVLKKYAPEMINGLHKNNIDE
ncbi:MAG: biotin transporter BioY [Spirochaetota bacterium]